jgi:hypothetical protein
MSPRRSPGGLEAVPGGYRSAPERSRLVDHNPQETSGALAPVRDGSVPRAHLLRATAFWLRYPGLPQWFGYRTPGQEEFERAGEEADDRLNELCEVIRAELHPHDSRRERALATGDGWLVSGLRRITCLFLLSG